MQENMTKSYSKKNYYPVFSPWIDSDDIDQVSSTLIAGNISGTSPIVKQFEQNFAQQVGVKHAVAVANGSIALDLALFIAEIQPGDEVILPSFTIISCLSAIVRVGGIPVFVDADPLTWNMKCTDINEAITPKTKVILAVHIYGLPTDVESLRKTADKHGIMLIEDSSEAHGLVINGKQCGSFGELSTFSFYANKHVTTGEGGMIVTNNSEIANKLEYFRNLAFNPKKRFEHTDFGWNYRLGGLAASLGVSQLKKLPKIVAEKQRQGGVYNSLLSNLLPDIQIPLAEVNGTTNNYWVYGIVLPDGIDRDKTAKNLAERSIETRPFFWGLHEQPLINRYEHRIFREMKVTERLSRKGLYLPLGADIHESDQEFIVQQLSELI
jgi:perosamine synthetase